MSTGKQYLTDTGNDLSSDEAQKMLVIEEKLVVTSESVETGRVLVSKKVFEEEAVFNGTIKSEEITVERKEINQYVQTAPPAVRQEGDVTIVSVVKEVLVVEKRLMLVEELHITKRDLHHQKTFTEKLRKEEVTVSRSGSGMDI
ncbi:YsnF/AvaK domain-containing protein [Dyadobacter psychrophilus]|uniref:Conserved domain-containing protein n=1 Tax=Dyadobacter psychrophilus TaxID=651661 RepID=A0A1T5G5L0_9BACT|nr:YsnF/AvaK domain-containing protein [Dyadobacter psychrophilus]SKC03718.1 conserved domain-containing protein [Dyadobacter psychrophilus]